MAEEWERYLSRKIDEDFDKLWAYVADAAERGGKTEEEVKEMYRRLARAAAEVGIDWQTILYEEGTKQDWEKVSLDEIEKNLQRALGISELEKIAALAKEEEEARKAEKVEYVRRLKGEITRLRKQLERLKSALHWVDLSDSEIKLLIERPSLAMDYLKRIKEKEEEKKPKAPPPPAITEREVELLWGDFARRLEEAGLNPEAYRPDFEAYIDRSKPLSWNEKQIDRLVREILRRVRIAERRPPPAEAPPRPKFGVVVGPYLPALPTWEEVEERWRKLTAPLTPREFEEMLADLGLTKEEWDRLPPNVKDQNIANWRLRKRLRKKREIV